MNKVKTACRLFLRNLKITLLIQIYIHAIFVRCIIAQHVIIISERWFLYSYKFSVGSYNSSKPLTNYHLKGNLSVEHKVVTVNNVVHFRVINTSQHEIINVPVLITHMNPFTDLKP